MENQNSHSSPDLKFYYDTKSRTLKVIFMSRFYFTFDPQDLDYFGFMGVDDTGHTIFFREPEHKFYFILRQKFSKLRTLATNREAFYLDSNLNIPLIGVPYIGIVDRNTNIIEVKPITGCNLDCIFCSVGEGLNPSLRDFVVDYNFLATETNKLISYKKDKNIEIHINPHGEPLLYKHLEEFISLIKQNKYVKKVTINTNFVLATKSRIDNLIQSGLDRFNISLNSLDKDKARILSGGMLNNIDRIKDMINYVVENYGSDKLLIAPVIVPGYNEDEIEDFVIFAKSLNITLGLQKYLEYKHGKKPVHEEKWKTFYSKLAVFENKYKIKLRLKPEDFGIHKTRQLPKPFRKGSIVNAKIISKGRFKYNFLGYVGYDTNPNDPFNARLVEIVNYKSKPLRAGSIVRVRIIRDKHNIFFAHVI